MLIVGEGGIVGLAQIVADAAQGQIHLRQPIGGGILFLTIDVDPADIAHLLRNEFSALDEHAAGTAARIYLTPNSFIAMSCLASFWSRVDTRTYPYVVPLFIFIMFAPCRWFFFHSTESAHRL